MENQTTSTRSTFLNAVFSGVGPSMARPQSHKCGGSTFYRPDVLPGTQARVCQIRTIMQQKATKQNVSQIWQIQIQLTLS